MQSHKTTRRRSGKLEMSLIATVVALATASQAWAICRVTDYSSKPLSALTEVQRVAFVSQMERTEFEHLKAKRPGDPNYYALVGDSTNVIDARKAAMDKLEGLKVDNIVEYRDFWTSEFLTEEQLRNYTNCVTRRVPGLFMRGLRVEPHSVNLTFSHITPIGIEKISTRVIATHNVANVAELEADLARLGAVDNYEARSVSLRLIDPTQRAVVVMRAGWETPQFLYIPASPTPEYFK